MILLGWTVDGFGPLRGFALDGLGPGLTVVVGPNEAGKSSLLAFLRFVLFGFAGREPRREPVYGGRHGGRIQAAERPGGPAWTLERHADRRGLGIVGPDGAPAGEAELRRLLGGADSTVFRNIFAFSLWELSQMASLTDEGVRGLVFSAGITGAGSDVRRVLGALEGEAEGLYRPRAASRIGRLTGELEQASWALAEAQAAAAAYPSLMEEQGRARQRVAALDADLQHLGGRQRRLVRLLEAWPVWQRWRQAARLLAETPDPGPFPEAGLQRMEDLLQRRRHARAELDRLSGQLREWEAQPRLPQDAAPAVEAVWAEAAAQRERWARLPDEEAHALQTGLQRGAALAELGAGWTPERLAGFSGGVTLADALQEWSRRMRDAELAMHDTRRALAEAGRTVEAAARQVSAYPAGLPEPGVWEERRRALAAAVTAAHAGQRLWTLAAFAAVGAAVLLGFGHRASGAVLLLPAAGLALAGRRGARMAALERDQAEHLAAGPAVSAGHQARLALEAARVAEGEARAAAAAGDATAQACATGWASWKADRGLPSELSPEGAGVFMQALHRAREAAAAADRAAARRDGLRQAVGRWEERARGALAGAGVAPAAGGAELLAQIESLQQRSEIERAAAQKAEETRARHSEISADVQGLDEQWQALMGAAGVAPGGDPGREEESFRQRATAARTRREAQDAERARRGELAAALGEGPGAEELRGALETGDAPAWQAELAEVQARATAAQGERDAAARAHWEAEAARADLEQRADVARYGADVEGLRAELTAAVRAWRVNAVAQALLRRTLSEFMAARQPDVLRVASHTFAAITGGRYGAVVQDEAGESLHAVDAAGRRVAPEGLSRGTAEQLYLAVRLGLAASFAGKAAPLPLVMDDVLVNFDPVRAAAAAEALAGFAREGAAEGRQVLLFTCHPETVACVRAADPGCRVVEMPAGPFEMGGGTQEAAAAREPEAGERRPGRGGRGPGRPRKG